MFTTRLISGIVLVILAIFFVGKGGDFFCSDSPDLSGRPFELYRVLGIEKTVCGRSWLFDSLLLLWDLMVLKVRNTLH